MLKWIESTGKTEDAAIEAALMKLGMDRDDVSVEVLERAKSGFLGIGSSPAKVKVTYEAPDEPEPVKPAPPPPEAKPEPKPVPPVRREPAPKPVVDAPPPPAREKAPETPAQELGDEAKTAQITAFLTGLLEHMGADAKPSVKVDGQGVYQVELLGENLGALIGRRGETLDAIQQLTSYSVNRGQTKRVRIHLDAEGYRAKREESLTRLARKVAGKVVKYRKNVTLEAIAKPDKEFETLMDPLTAAYAHEQYVTSLINAIYAAAQEAHDYRTVQFLDWFVKEQGEEEKNSSDMITKMELFGSDAKALYMLNSELAGRVYSAPSLQL